MNIFTHIKTKFAILDLINEYVALKKAGYYWKGSCPFHAEKTASFTVSPHRDIFYCFGCHTGGDSIAFISKIENCSQLEAAKLLADKYNIEVPTEYHKELSVVNLDKKKRYFQLCQLVADWCKDNLEKNPSIEHYLTERGFSIQILRAFQVGYFPSSLKNIHALTNYVSQHGFLQQDLIEAGILQEGKVPHSPFEERIIFPIKTHLGNFCGFGGRIFKPHDERSKYYNSKENNYFQKGSLLFGLEMAKKEIQKTERVFLVEGYTDCIAMVQAGYKNTVATLGTACTLEHLKALSHHAHTLFVVYDGDKAGHQATLRLATLCWQANLEVAILTLPEQTDPASYLKIHPSLEEPLSQAQDIFTFFLQSLGKNYAQSSLQQKIHATRECLEVIKRIEDPLKRDILLQKAAAIFGLPLDSLKKELASLLYKTSSTTQAYNKPIQSYEETEKMSALEKSFMCAILNDTQLLQKSQICMLLEHLPEPLKQIALKLQNIEGNDERILFAHFFDRLTEKEQQLVNRLLVQDYSQEETPYEMLIELLEKKYWKKIVETTKYRLTQAQKNQDTEQVNKLVKEFLELKKKLLHKGLI